MNLERTSNRQGTVRRITIRRILNAVALLACIALLAIWLACRHQPRALIAQSLGGRLVVIASDQHRLYFLDCNASFNGIISATGARERMALLSITRSDLHDASKELLGDPHGPIAQAGFRMAISSATPNPFPAFRGLFLLVVPYWGLLGVMLVWFGLRARRWHIRRRRKRRGLCVECGYDLRMTPDRCPECGLRP